MLFMKKLKSIELFAGAGGLALGMEKAGFEPLLLNELERNPSETLRINRPHWNVVEQDIHTLSLMKYKGKVDLITGGFPCQAFSHSGKRLGLQDVRGTLFYEFARAIRESEPSCFLAENVKGLLSHDKGETLSVILNVFSDLGYHVFTPLLLNANNYEVAQKRERVFIFGVKKSLSHKFSFTEPKTHSKINLKDIFFSGKYYSNDVSDIVSVGTTYSKEKQKLFNLIEPGKNWKSLSEELQKQYLGNMFHSEGGKTGILKRLSYSEPCVTLLTSPSQKQTERCHPIHCRPLNIREYARIQSFPDEWIFNGSISSQYKQIGNAVPVMLAYHVGKMIHDQMVKNLKS